MIIKTKNANVEEETNCTEAAIPQTVENEINIDPKKITNFIDRKLSAQCEQCRNNINTRQFLQSIQDVFKITEIKFTDICQEPSFRKINKNF